MIATETTNATSVKERQNPKIAQYHLAPETARITDRAKSVGGVGTDPFHGRVVLGRDDLGVTLPFGIHHGVGGYHDAPNPGDLLCAAVAACMDSTVRLIAERLQVRLTSLEIEVTADVDLRGTLLVDAEVPVRFQELRSEVRLSVAEGTPPRIVEKLIAAAEHSCVNLQTLRAGVPVVTAIEAETL